MVSFGFMGVHIYSSHISDIYNPCLCCSFVGESMHDDGSLVFAYYKEGATDPTFLYFAYGLKEIKC